jgi:hypothetical protein
MQLIRSDDEAIRLAAVKEAFDRMLGKAPIAADVTTTKFDLGAAYLSALKLANLPPGEAAIDIIPAPDAPAGAECNSTTEW